MRRCLVHSPSPALIVALVALVVALAGGAYAAVNLPPSSVGTKQLKDRAVTERKLATNAVTSAKVRDGSLLARDFKAGQLPAGPRGPEGPRGLGDAYSLSIQQSIVTPPRHLEPFAYMTLPPGNYVVIFEAAVANGMNASAPVDCDITVDIPSPHHAGVDLSPGEEAPLVIVAPVTVTADSNVVVLECSSVAPRAGQVTFGPGEMTALQVGALHTQ